jgi:hypothetical protein
MRSSDQVDLYFMNVRIEVQEAPKKANTQQRAREKAAASPVGSARRLLELFLSLRRAVKRTHQSRRAFDCHVTHARMVQLKKPGAGE